MIEKSVINKDEKITENFIDYSFLVSNVFSEFVYDLSQEQTKKIFDLLTTDQLLAINQRITQGKSWY